MNKNDETHPFLYSFFIWVGWVGDINFNFAGYADCCRSSI
jgi:hypothetical protein